MNKPVHVAIIGSGITGLSAAFYLKKAAANQNVPLHCTVFERDTRFGGKIQTHREDGFVMEAGPDSLLARKPAGLQLIRELGIESELVSMNPAMGKTYVVVNGGLVPFPSGTNMGIPVMMRPFLQSKLLSPQGKLRILADLWRPKETTIVDESLGALLRRRLGNEAVDVLCEPLLAGIYAGNIDQLSVQATFPDFQKMATEEGSLIRASIRRFRQRPRPTPTGRSMFVTLRHGLQTLVERLCESVQDTTEFMLNTAMNQFSQLPDGSYKIDVTTNGQSTTITADAVILTTPAPIAADLLTSHIPSAHLLREIPYVSTATVMIGYTKQSVHANLDATGFVVPRREKRAITASTWVSTKWPHTTGNDHVMIRCYVGRALQQEYLNLSDTDIVQLVQAELRDLLGITATPAFAKVTRWQDSMPQYLIHHLDKIKQVETELATRLPGVLIAGAGYRGVGIPDCIAQGQLVANETLKKLLQFPH